MLQRPGGTETIIKGICGAVALTLVYLTVRHSDRREQRNMRYRCLAISNLCSNGRPERGGAEGDLPQA